MKILCIMTAYNEIKFLPYKKKFCDNNNIKMYVIDNMSTDGTYEWLLDNNIHTHRVDTHDMFDLAKLQREIIATIHRVVPHPDWIIYNGVDLFPVVLPDMETELARLDKEGCTLASMPTCAFYNTGEEWDTYDPINTYFYYGGSPSYTMIHKYSSNISYDGDTIRIGGINKVGEVDGFMINYGHTKPKREREETYLRRKRAWDAGVTPKAHGNHYRAGVKNKWKWNSHELNDSRKSQFKQHVDQLIDWTR